LLFSAMGLSYILSISIIGSHIAVSLISNLSIINK
jgi:hypothetical protein